MRAVSAGLGAVAVVVVAIGWSQPPDRLTAAEAVDAAQGAFRAAGISEAAVDPHPQLDTYRSGHGGSSVPVWRTSASVEGGTVELWLARSDGESVYLDDRSPDGASQLLTDAEFRQLASHYDNPAVDRQVRRNVLLTVAAALVSLVAVGLAGARRRLAATATGRLPPPAPRRDPQRPRRDRPLRAAPEAP